jgi:hypothetical protein
MGVTSINFFCTPPPLTTRAPARRFFGLRGLPLFLFFFFKKWPPALGLLQLHGLYAPRTYMCSVYHGGCSRGSWQPAAASQFFRQSTNFIARSSQKRRLRTGTAHQPFFPEEEREEQQQRLEHLGGRSICRQEPSEESDGSKS